MEVIATTRQNTKHIIIVLFRTAGVINKMMAYCGKIVAIGGTQWFVIYPIFNHARNMLGNSTMETLRWTADVFTFTVTLKLVYNIVFAVGRRDIFAYSI